MKEEKKEETVSKTPVKVTLPKHEIIQFTNALASLSFVGITLYEEALAVIHTLKKARIISNEIDDEVKTIEKANKPNTYDSLEEKVKDKTATDEEKENFSSMKKKYEEAKRILIDKLMKEQVSIEVETISTDMLKELIKSSSNNVTPLGYVFIEEYLVK